MAKVVVASFNLKTILFKNGNVEKKKSKEQL